MRKLLFFGDDLNAKTGFSYVNAHIFNVIDSLDFDVIYLARNPSGTMHSDHHIVNIPVGTNPLWLFREHVMHNIPDIIIIQEDMNLAINLIYGSTLGAAKTGKVYPGIQDLISAHNIKVIWIGPHDSYNATKMDKQFINDIDITMPYSIFGKKILNASHCFRLGPVHISGEYNIENPVRRCEYGKKFLTIGINRYKKRLDILVKSFIKYRLDVPSAELTIKTAPGGYFNELFDMDKQNIHIINQSLNTNALSKLYLENDTYISCTPNEGWGLPLTDATHYNMGIIAPDFPNHDESTGGQYNKIVTLDLFDSDGYRIVPIPLYAYTSDMMAAPTPNNKCINYWDESEKKLRNILEEL